MLIGCCDRQKLIKALDDHIGLAARQVEYHRKMNEAVVDLGNRFRNIDDQSEGDKRRSIFESFDEAAPELGAPIGLTPRRTQSASSLNVSLVADLGRRRSISAGNQRPLFVKPEVSDQKFNAIFKNFTKRFWQTNETAVEEYYLSREEHMEWEKQQLSAQIKFNKIKIDLAPFQIVETTSIFKVHTLFSLLSLKRIFVTKSGQLVGVVSLKDVSLGF